MSGGREDTAMHDRARILAGALSRALGLALALFLVAAPAGAATFNIEIDWMDVTGPGGHSHRPQAAEVEAIQQMFACQGHTLNIDVSNAVTHFNVLEPEPGNLWNIFAYSGVPASFGAIKQANFNHAGQPGWHYCIFGHQYRGTDSTVTTSSGYGEMPGDDFIVTLGAFSNQIGTAFERASILAHEFGHNLGLPHCTGGNCDDPGGANYMGPFQENLPSIMSYLYTLAGIRTNLICQGLALTEAALFKEIDYSHGRLCAVDENNLDEKFGLGMRGVDWDCDGSIEGFRAHDLNGNANGWCSASGPRQSFGDVNEWDLVVDLTYTQTAADLMHMPVVSCITAEEAVMLRGGCPQATLATEDCIDPQSVAFARVGAGWPHSGTCQRPYASVRDAHDAVPPGTTLFLIPGTYTETGTLTLDRRMIIYSPGSAGATDRAIIRVQ
jgi:hypothetical protein